MAPEYITRKQAAEILSCSDQLISKLIKNGTLPACKLGAHAIRIRRSDLDAMVAAWSTSAKRTEVKQ